ncbi:ABC transporter substrate-binding protein [Stomatohabitans albus]|uniref:ABC transporter substrate-binding protein n=1 Tax=Stomatohabitans albus TaxID=3110766 RepID=UPI00300D2BE0
MSGKLVSFAAATMCALALSACTAPAPTEVGGSSEAAVSNTPSETTATQATSEPAKVAKDEPTKVMSCDQELTFEKAPERIVTLADDSISFLWELGLHDKVVGMGKAPNPEVYKPDVLEALNQVPIIEGSKTEGGGAVLSTESILALDPDLVIGYDSGADREGLNKAGVPFYSPEAWCITKGSNIPDDVEPASFDLVEREVLSYGKIFHIEDKATELVKNLDNQIEAIKSQSPDSRGTAMAVYINEGSDKFFAYGKTSMVQPLFEAVGLTNVYGDRKERRIDGMSMEEILKRNPDNIVLLFNSGTGEGSKETFKSIVGASNLDAVKNNKLYAMPFRFVDPPSPNTVNGLERLNELFGQ